MSTEYTRLRAVLGSGGRPGLEAYTFIREALELSGAERPNILVLPSAKSDQDGIDSMVAQLRSTFQPTPAPSRLLVAHRAGELPSREHFLDLLDWASVVYVAGGDTIRLIDSIRTIGVESELIQAFTGPGSRVSCGISAGFLYLCRQMQTDTESYNLAQPGDDWDYQTSRGLGVLPVFGGVHYNGFHPDTGFPRAQDFRSRLLRLREGTIGFTATNQAAWVLPGNGTAWVAGFDFSALGFRLCRDKTAKHGIRSQKFPANDKPVPLDQLMTA